MSKKPSLVPRLCFTAICMTKTYGLRLSAPTVRLWRRIFRRIAVALQGLPEDVSLTYGTRRLINDCFEQIEELDVGNNYRGPLGIIFNIRKKDPAKEQEWRHQFKAEESSFSNHLVFLLSRLLPDDERTDLNSWRLRMLDDMSEGDRVVAIADDEHDDDPEETAGETIPAASSGTGDPAEEDGKRDNETNRLVRGWRYLTSRCMEVSRRIINCQTSL